MAHQFKLLFRGALAPDQDKSVVRGRLQALLKINDEQTAAMFSGKPMIIKKSADEATAKKFKGAFAKAGAVLEIVALTASDSAVNSAANSKPAAEDKAPAAQSPKPAAKGPAQAAKKPMPNKPASAPAAQPTGEAEPAANPSAESRFALSAAGADLLAPDERRDFTPVDVPTDHLSLAFPGQDLGSDDPAAPPPPAPDTAHLTLDELGAILGDEDEEAMAVALLDVDFDVAEVGAVLDQIPPDQPPAAPDTSHLSLSEAPATTE